MRFVGLEKDGEVFLAASGKRRKTQVEVEKLQSWPVASSNVKQLYKKKFKSTPFVTGLNSCEVLTKHLTIPASSYKQLEKTLPFQIESQLFLKDKNFICFPIIQGLKGNNNVDLYLTTEASLKKHLQLWQDLKLDPEQVCFYSLALVRYAKSFFPDLSEGYLLHIGRSYTMGVWMDKSLPFQSFFLDLGWNFLKEIFHKEQITEKNVFEKKDILPCSLVKWEKALQRNFQSLGSNKKLPLLLTGNGEKFFPWIYNSCNPYVTKQLKSDPENAHLNPYAVSIGLAMNALAKDRYSVQFRQKEFLSSSFFKKVGKKYFLGILLFLSVAGFFSGIQEAFVQREKRRLEKILRNAYELEKEVSPNQWQIFPETAFQEKMQSWGKILEEQEKASKLTSFSPYVSSFLNWLSHHPLLQSSETEVQEVFYELKKFPTLDSPNTPYIPFVTIRIKISNPSIWRKFFEAISSDKKMINTKKEIEWHQNQDIYEISFYLQAKR